MENPRIHDNPGEPRQSTPLLKAAPGLECSACVAQKQEAPGPVEGVPEAGANGGRGAGTPSPAKNQGIGFAMPSKAGLKGAKESGDFPRYALSGKSLTSYLIRYILIK